MRLLALQSKDVINVCDGNKVGYISDIEINWCTKCVEAIIVEKNSFLRIFCFFKEAPCVIIPVDLIVSFGGDVILVNMEV